MFAPLAAISFVRKDLVVKALQLGVLGGCAGLVSEFFYFRDYWRPPSLFGTATLSPEDFLFGFAITALAFAAYPLLFGAHLQEQQYPTRRKLYALFFAGSVCALLFLNLYLGINSILVSYVIFLGLAVPMLLMRPDLLKVGLYAAAAVTSFAILVYILLFDVISPHYDKYWLLHGTRWGMAVLGHVPITEIVWYFSWVLFASISYPFVSGRVVSPRQK